MNRAPDSFLGRPHFERLWMTFYSGCIFTCTSDVCLRRHAPTCGSKGSASIWRTSWPGSTHSPNLKCLDITFKFFQPLVFGTPQSYSAPNSTLTLRHGGLKVGTCRARPCLLPHLSTSVPTNHKPQHLRGAIILNDLGCGHRHKCTIDICMT